MEQTTSAGLVRDIRRWDLVALMINSILGASIFGLPSTIYALTGTYSLLTVLVCALVIALIILCFAEVSSRFTGTGGQYLYAREAFGPVVGFEIGWLMWLQRLTSFAAVCNLLIVNLAYFWPAAGSGVWRAAAIAGVVTFLTVVNIIGVRDAALVSNLFTTVKLAVLLLFVIVGLFFIDPHNYSFATRPGAGAGAFSTSALLFISAFTGFEAVAIPAGEIRDPRRNLPFAMFIALVVVTLLYILIQIVCIGTLPGLGDSERPLTDASSRFLGAAGAFVISAGALVSMTGTLSVIMLSGPRVLFAMAEQGQLPSVLSITHRRFHTPYVAILLTAGLMLVVTISGTFIYALTINMIIRLVNYATTCAALPVLRRKSDERPATFMVPAGTVVSIVSVALCVWLLSSSGWREARDAGVAAAFGLILYVAYRLGPESHSKKPAGSVETS